MTHTSTLLAKHPAGGCSVRRTGMRSAIRRPRQRPELEPRLRAVEGALVEHPSSSATAQVTSPVTEQFEPLCADRVAAEPHSHGLPSLERLSAPARSVALSSGHLDRQRARNFWQLENQFRER